MGRNAHTFKKGEIHNPKGRPKELWTWSGLIKAAMEARNADGEAIKEAVAAALVAKAMEGDVLAIKEIGNRIDGMPKQSIELEVVKPLIEFNLHGKNNDSRLNQAPTQTIRGASDASDSTV